MTDGIKMKKEQDELLIELVRSHSILYDAAHINYKNNILKHKVLEEIAQVLKIPGKCFLLYYVTNISLMCSNYTTCDCQVTLPEAEHK